MTAKGYRSDVLAAVHETALGMTEAGTMSKRAMREFDEMCLTSVTVVAARRDPDAKAAGERKPGGVPSSPQRDGWLG